MWQSKRDQDTVISVSQLEEYARSINEALGPSFNTYGNEHTLISIFAQRSFPQLRAIFQRYRHKFMEPIDYALIRIKNKNLRDDLLYIG